MWYYVINGQQVGPVSQTELQQKLQNELSASTLVWREGLDEWTKAADVPELNPTVITPPMLTASTPPNLYSAPHNTTPGLTVDQEYLFPTVKRANFPLLLSLKILGIILIISSCVFFFITIFQEFGIDRNYEATELVTDNHHTPHSSSYSHNISPTGQYSEESDIIIGRQHPNNFFVDMGTFFVLILSGGTIFATGSILGLVYLYRAWTILQPAGSNYSPGEAVGFLFIPFFNFYWIFVAYHKWAEEWNKLTQSRPTLSRAPKAAKGIFLGMAISYCSLFITSIIGLFVSEVLYLIGMKSMCNVINFVAEQNAQNQLRRR